MDLCFISFSFVPSFKSCTSKVLKLWPRQNLDEEKRFLKADLDIDSFGLDFSYLYSASSMANVKSFKSFGLDFFFKFDLLKIHLGQGYSKILYTSSMSFFMFQVSSLDLNDSEVKFR